MHNRFAIRSCKMSSKYVLLLGDSDGVFIFLLDPLNNRKPMKLFVFYERNGGNMQTLEDSYSFHWYWIGIFFSSCAFSLSIHTGIYTHKTNFLNLFEMLGLKEKHLSYVILWLVEALLQALSPLPYLYIYFMAFQNRSIFKC